MNIYMLSIFASSVYEKFVYTSRFHQNIIQCDSFESDRRVQIAITGYTDMYTASLNRWQIYHHYDNYQIVFICIKVSYRRLLSKQLSKYIMSIFKLPSNKAYSLHEINEISGLKYNYKSLELDDWTKIQSRPIC